MIRILLGIFALFWSVMTICAQEIRWEYCWTGDTNVPKVTMSPYLYGKTWAYTVELDDGGIMAKSTAQPLMADYKFTDAPPGIKGGKEIPFTGSVAIMVCNMDGGNNTVLSWGDVKFLRERGWDITNHSYWHTGCHWDKSKILSPDQFKRELFWSQALFSHFVYDDKQAPLSFVYPSGDYNYKPFLKEFNLVAGSRVSGSSAASFLSPDFNVLEIGRSNLDNLGTEKNKDPMGHFPKGNIIPGTMHTDFTHGINTGKDSDNYNAWQSRLKCIAEKYGRDGADNLWCAPKSELVKYILAAKSAKIDATAGKITLTLPANTIATRLTIIVEGIPENINLDPPPGGIIYRRGDKTWLTTPVIGKPNPIPGPEIKIGYEGTFAPVIKFPAPMKVAAVRILQQGKFVEGFIPKISFILPDGGKQELNVEKIHKWILTTSKWGFWCLYPLLPEETAVLAGGVELAPDPAFKKVEVWVVKD